MKSGTISHSQETSLILNYEVGENDSIAFYYKVSSENNYDKFYFYIDNQEMGNWSGTVAWTRAQYVVTAGAHTFRWKYKKDNSVSNGSDCCWIDYVILPADRSLSVSAGIDINICVDESAQLNGYAVNQTSLEWTTSGDGTFSNATIANPIYTPGSQDIANGGATLTLTGYKNTETMSDEIQISFIDEPIATGETEFNLTDIEPFEVSIEIENLGYFAGWTTTGEGRFVDTYALTTTYIPTQSDFDAVDIILTASYTGCGYKTYEHDVNVHFSHEGVNTLEAPVLSIHPNPTNNVLNVNISNITSDVQMNVYNAVGQLVYTMKENVERGLSTTIDLSTLTTGTYILQIRSEEGVWTKKIMKK